MVNLKGEGRTVNHSLQKDPFKTRHIMWDFDMFHDKVSKFEVIEANSEQVRFFDRRLDNIWLVVKLPNLRICILKNPTMGGNDWGTTFYREPKTTFDEPMARSFLEKATERFHRFNMARHRRKEK